MFTLQCNARERLALLGGRLDERLLFRRPLLALGLALIARPCSPTRRRRVGSCRRRSEYGRSCILTERLVTADSTISTVYHHVESHVDRLALILLRQQRCPDSFSVG